MEKPELKKLTKKMTLKEAHYAMWKNILTILENYALFFPGKRNMFMEGLKSMAVGRPVSYTYCFACMVSIMMREESGADACEFCPVTWVPGERGMCQFDPRSPFARFETAINKNLRETAIKYAKIISEMEWKGVDFSIKKYEERLGKKVWQ